MRRNSTESGASFNHNNRRIESEVDDDDIIEVCGTEAEQQNEVLDIEMDFEQEEEEDDHPAIGDELKCADDCLRWLQSIGYGQYVSKLRRQWIEDKMDGKTLRLLDQSHLV